MNLEMRFGSVKNKEGFFGAVAFMATAFFSVLCGVCFRWGKVPNWLPNIHRVLFENMQKPEKIRVPNGTHGGVRSLIFY